MFAKDTVNKVKAKEIVHLGQATTCNGVRLLVVVVGGGFRLQLSDVEHFFFVSIYFCHPNFLFHI